MKIVAFLTAATAVWSLAACAHRKPVRPPTASIAGLEGPFRRGQIIDLQQGKVVAFDELITALGDHHIVFVGEVHDNPEHHLLQVQILQSLMARYGPVTLAMEFFQRHQQPILDRYTQGIISESQFLREVDWKTTWGFDYHLYRPLLLQARNQSARILAINAPRHVVRKIARQGLGSLNVEERNQVAEEIDLGSKPHRSMVQQAYELDAHKGIRSFEAFYEAQCTWEDTMAESIAAYVEESNRRVVVLSGNGHMVYGFGIPDRTARRSSASLTTVVLYPLGGSAGIPRELADYVWFTRECTAPHGGATRSAQVVRGSK
jgi:uncharacterized iron-regulated protein